MQSSEWQVLFDDLPDGFQASQSDRAVVDRVGGKGSAIYGEIDDATFERILNWWRPGPDDVVYDLGSGTGRFAIQSICTTEVGRFVALELSAFRHEMAETARQRMRSTLEVGDRLSERLELRCADFLAEPLVGATLIYCGSTCFPADLWERTCAHIGATAPALRSLIAPRPLPDGYQGPLREVGRFSGSASWMSDVDVYAFSLRPERVRADEGL